jgi:hypothetical protein
LDFFIGVESATMTAMMCRACALSALLLVACGDDSGTASPDARRADARIIDAAADDCDYTEQSDLTNDTTSQGTSELTGLTFATRTVICGTIDHTHFDGSITVDGDSFTLNVASDTDVIVRFLAPTANTVELIGVDVYSGTTRRGTATFYGNHGVVSARLPAGTFELIPLALNAEQITTSIPYRIEVTADSPDTRRPEVTAGGFTEVGDGAQDNGNNIFAIPMTGSTTFTSANDADEMTNLAIAAGVNYRVAGSAANGTVTDKYEDIDTYEIATLATNELTIRLAWPTAGADLDWYLWEKNTTMPTFAAGSTTTGTTGEIQLTSIKPNATYWLTVGAKTGITADVAYNATLCGAQFAP